MTDRILCITHQLADEESAGGGTTQSVRVNPCTVLNEHYPDLIPTDNPEQRARHLARCSGCLPRPAEVGFVCMAHFNRADRAVSAYDRFRTALTGIDKAIQAESTTRGRPGSQLPIPALRLAFDELESYQASRRGRPTEQWVANEHDAADAVRFARSFEAAERAHPVAETSHKVQVTRCPRCEHKTLVWHPPTYFLGHVHVACSYRDAYGDTCGFEADQSSYEKIAAIEKPEVAA